MQDAAHRWEQLYNQTPLCDVPRHYAGMSRSPFLMEYLQTVLRLCPRGGRTCEAGIGSGYGAIWLSRRGTQAEGIDYSPGIVERARQINGILGGHASFRVGDLFDFYQEFGGQSATSSSRPSYAVIHHQGVLEHFAVPWIRAALAQQLACAQWVVFSVPSVYYPFEPEFGDERLLPLEEWQRILEPFEVAELKYYGDPQLGAQEHVLGVLRGVGAPGSQTDIERLAPLMQVAEEPYPPGISAIVHTRNEARHIAECLQTLQGWTDEIIVCDMESEDDTLAIAAQYTDNIIAHPRITNFDRARNVSAMRAKYRWVFYLDADERVPPALGAALRRLADQAAPVSEAGSAKNAEHGSPLRANDFAGLLIPFRHHFVGHWMQCLYPGYTAPRLFRNGRFIFNARPHMGAQVDGPTALFPADNPDLALVHHSFDSMAHYLDKLNRYTDGEAANMHRDGHSFHWQHALRDFVLDCQAYYDQRGAARDGVHGFLYSILSGFYRFEQHAKLYEHRFRQGQLQPGETALPASFEEMAQFMLDVARHKPLPRAPEIKVDSQPGVAPAANADKKANPPADVVWSGPLDDPSGYGEESRNFLFALEDQGVSVAAQPLPWSYDRVDLAPAERSRLEGLAQRAVKPGFIQVIQNFPTAFQRHPEAGVAIGRTMFETDRLPQAWVQGCNRMDYVWVPTEFNRQTFAGAGVETRKLAVMPGCLDAAVFQDATPRDGIAQMQQVGRQTGLAARLQERREAGEYVFLTVFDWTRHKGWDVLLRAFLEEFKRDEKVTLELKVWSTNGYSPEAIREQAAAFVQHEMGDDLLSDPRILFLQERVSQTELLALYGACDAFVLPSRGEGWGRPYMEAMASGLPTIGTGWSGNTAFMSRENSYLLDCEVVPVPEVGWREIPTYRGHRWAEPDKSHLQQMMRRVVVERGEAAALGQRAREEVLARYNRSAVGKLMAAEIERIRDERGTHDRGRRPASESPTKREAAESTSGSLSTALVESEAWSPLILPPAVAQERQRASQLAKEQKRSPMAVRWEGAFFSWHSLAHVNREFCLRLLEREDVELALVPTEPNHFAPAADPRFPDLAARLFAPLSKPAQVQVRHFFPPRFEAPAQGHLVLIQPWEYGYLPARWIEPIQEQVSEVWCYSEYVRQVYRDSGIAEERLHVVPLGVDTNVFNPAAPPYVFTVEPGAATHQSASEQSPGQSKVRGSSTKEDEAAPRPFTFLFVGGTLHRKGIDILLAAYAKAFTSLDEVCLVIKDTGTQTVYQGQNAREQILQRVGQPNQPPLVYLEDDLTAYQLAGLYTACDCLVQPYRGEGFCLPALEAMACGVPVIVPAGGPTDDFVDETVGWRVSAARQPFGDGRIGEWDCVGPTWMFEVAVDDLAKLLRRIVMQPEDVRQRGQAAKERVEAGWTWEHACARALQRLQSLARQPVAAKTHAARPYPAHVTPPQQEGRQPKRKKKPVYQEKAVTQHQGEHLAPLDGESAGPIPPQQVVTPPESEGLPVMLRRDAPSGTSDERSGIAGLDPGITPLVTAGTGLQRTSHGVLHNGHQAADDSHSHGNGQLHQNDHASSEAGGIIWQRAQPTISLCMIVRNEERVLGDCLASIQPWVDEIILVDTGSKDRTVEIAQSHGVQLYHFPWCDSFSAARNESLSHATGDWILWMDADDTIPEACGRKLRELVALAEDETTGFLIQVHIPPAPGDHGFTVVDHVKLFRNWPELRFEGRIHEQILEPIYRVGGRIERSDLYVVHSGYDYSPEGQQRKRERDFLLLHKDLEDRPDHPFVLFNIGMTAYHLKDFDQALPALERCLALSKPHESTVRKVYAMLAGCHLGKEDIAKAVAVVEQGLKRFPHDPELLFRAGIIYREAGNLEAAEQSYLKLLTAREVGHIDSIDVTMTGYKAHHNLALIYMDMGRFEEAEAQWQAAVRDNPAFVPSWVGLGEIYLRTGRMEAAKALVERLKEVDAQQAALLQSRLPE